MNFLKMIFGNRSTKIWAITSIVILVLMIAIIIAIQIPFLNQSMNTFFGGKRRVITSPSGESYMYYESDYVSKGMTLQKANELNEVIVSEGAILLKNDNNTLPLTDSRKISVFGKNSVNLVYGGSGSGEKADALETDLYSSLTAAGFNVNPDLKDFYNDNSRSGDGRPDNPAMGSMLTGLETGETPILSYSQAIKDSYDSYNDAAVIVFSRVGGEGYDLPRSMKLSFTSSTPIEGAVNADDHYLQLDANERAVLAEAKVNFEKVIVILNCATTMEIGDIADDAGIDSILWIGTTGGTGINAVGKILNGEVNPSGRTVDTYARDFKTDPTWQNFGFNEVEYGNRYQVDNNNKPYYFVDYEEGIYVGYRYWETRGLNDEPWYQSHVVYPFGHGLSYTDFSWEIVSTSLTDQAILTKFDTIEVSVEVENTGTLPGKEVVELYYTAPYTSGGIEKAHVVLGAFAKSEILEPGDTQILDLELQVMDMASYDYNDANENGFIGYELEPGDYEIKIMRNAHELVDSLTYTVPALGFLVNSDTAYGVQPINRFDDVSAKIDSTDTDATGGSMTVMSRADFDNTMPTTPTISDRNVVDTFIDMLKIEKSMWLSDVDKPYYSATMPTQASSELSADQVDVMFYELIGVDYDDPLWDNFLDQLTIEQMSFLIGSGNFHTIDFEALGKPETTDPDGPVGFTNFLEFGEEPKVYDTCFYASPTVIAATWNVDLAYEQGKMVGNEGIWGNFNGDEAPYSGWYAPAVNIHRTPFSGRNWEYYSEDGFMSGIMAAHVIQGAKEKGVYTYVKHFAVNDQETNRDSNGLATWLDEQTMREIYLKPFELAVKVGETSAIMSSFNRIGTVWTGGSYELITEVLRDEWGFKGMVITDYNVYNHMPTDQMIRAGGDLNLIQDKRPTTSSDALTSTQVSLMRQASKNILYTVVNSNAMNGLGYGAVITYKLPQWTVTMIFTMSSIGVVILGSGVCLIYRVKKKESVINQ